MAGYNFRLFTALLWGICCSRFITAKAVKLKLATEHDCDRHSLDALYHEKYARETENALNDITEFVNRTTDLMVDSLTNIMANLPGKESSDREEHKVFLTFNEMKKKFVRSVNKLKSNVTSAWESLIQANYELMLDNGKLNLSDVLNRTNYLADVYTSSRSILDASLASVISSLKDIVRHSMQGISTVAEKTLREERRKKPTKSNDTLEASASAHAHEDEDEDDDEDDDKKQEPDDEKSLKDMEKEMVKLLAPQFLGKVSMAIIDRDVDLGRNITTKSEDRDSVLDDICFTLIMIRSRVNTIINKDASKSKETEDLARRNLYIYFAENATHMYKERIKEKGDTTSTGSNGNRQIWKDENELADTLVNLMENYP